MYQIQLHYHNGTSMIKIFIHGPAGSGKSSFVRTLVSIDKITPKPEYNNHPHRRMIINEVCFDFNGEYVKIEFTEYTTDRLMNPGNSTINSVYTARDVDRLKEMYDASDGVICFVEKGFKMIEHVYHELSKIAEDKKQICLCVTKSDKRTKPGIFIDKLRKMEKSEERLKAIPVFHINFWDYGRYEFASHIIRNIKPFPRMALVNREHCHKVLLQDEVEEKESVDGEEDSDVEEDFTKCRIC